MSRVFCDTTNESQVYTYQVGIQKFISNTTHLEIPHGPIRLSPSSGANKSRDYFFWSTNSPILGASCKRNHTAFVLLGVAYFT